MPTFIKTGYWDKKAKAPKEWLDLDLLISQHAGSGATAVTKTGIDTLITANGLTPGAYYIIEGVDPTLYGGTTIIIQAATTNTLALAGHGIFYNPKYLNSKNTVGNGYGIWNEGGTYAIGDNVIWGGRHFTNKTGNVGTSVNKYRLNAADWIGQAFDSETYNVVADIIHYDYEHDMIIRRKDKWNNDVDGNYIMFTAFDDDNYKPIKDFQWGNGPEDFDTGSFEEIGVYSNYVKDSYLECLNFTGLRLSENTLTQKSVISNNYNSYGYSKIYKNTISNSSSIYFNTLTNSEIYSNFLVNTSIISNNLLNSSSGISLNTLTTDCSITENTLEGCGIDRNELLNASVIRTNVISFSVGICFNILHNNSIIETTGVTANNGTVQHNTLKYSEITNNGLGQDSSIYGNFLNYSYIGSNTLGDSSGISNNELSTSSYIISNTLNQGSVYANTLSNNCQIGSNSIGTYCQINNNILNDQSYISNITLLNSSNVNSNSLSSISTISNVSVDDTGISRNFLHTSEFNLGGTIGFQGLTNVYATQGDLGNLTGATIIYGSYTKQLFRNSLNIVRLGYYNASDIFTIVNTNA